VEDYQYQACFLGIPFYQVSGIVLGMPVLRMFRYLRFDNRQREATFATAARFEPEESVLWDRYPMICVEGPPVATLDVAGAPLRLLVDTGGGPHLILTAADWKIVQERVKIVAQAQDRCPTWGGFEDVDAYDVQGLIVANQELGNRRIWVSRDDHWPGISMAGLGCFDRTEVVYDFDRRMIWIQRTDRRLAASRE
jgi:hypothetical protein